MLYRYGRDVHGAIADVLALEREAEGSARQFSCVGCDGAVVPVLGQSRERHFRHKHIEGQKCSRESYLHKLAKTVIAKAFQTAASAGEPYWLTLEAPQVCRHWEKQFDFVCQRELGERAFDLTRHFDTVAIEAGVEGFVADVLLSSSTTGRKMLIEIAVSHECTPQKIASGLRILEVGVDEEDDAVLLSSGIDTRKHWFRFHNAKPQAPLEISCGGKCERELASFHVFESGKSLIKVGTPQEIFTVMQQQRTVHSHVIERAKHGIVAPYLAFERGCRNEALRALRAGAPIKSCSLCRYAGFRTREKPVFCKVKRVEVGVNEAASCGAYNVGT